MKKSLFVAGLDYAINEVFLKELFASYGTVENVKIITDRDTGKSRGFGFVDMLTQQQAQQCVEALNNTTIKGRQIVVKFKEQRTGSFNSQVKTSFASR